MELIMIRNLNNARYLLKSITSSGLSGSLRNVRCVCQFDDTRWTNRLYGHKPKTWWVSCHFPASSSLYTLGNHRNESIRNSIYYSTSPKDEEKNETDILSDSKKKVSIFQKMRQLTKDYWHVLVPVHIVTSIGWVSICYIAAKNGVDVIKLMEYLNLPERYINVIKNSNAGHWAVTYALYKLLTPLRYTVTVGGTTLAIRYLNRLGILKFSRPATAAPTSTTKNARTKSPSENESKNLKSN